MIVKKNVPMLERTIRVLVGACIACGGYFLAPSGLLLWLSAAVGIGLACSGFIGFCPMRALLGRKEVK